MARVDHDVGALLKVLQQGAFLTDAVDETAVALQQRIVQFRGQLVDAQMARVDHDVGALLKVLQQGAFLTDAVDETAVALQRMRATHRFEPFDQHLVVGVQEQDARFDTLLTDAVDETAVALQRMRATHRFEPFDQHLVVGVQEQDARFDTQIIEVAQHGGQVGEIITRPHVDDGGEPVHATG